MTEKHDAMWGPEAGEEIASLHSEIERLRSEITKLRNGSLIDGRVKGPLWYQLDKILDG